MGIGAGVGKKRIDVEKIGKIRKRLGRKGKKRISLTKVWKDE